MNDIYIKSDAACTVNFVVICNTSGTVTINAGEYTAQQVGFDTSLGEYKGYGTLGDDGTILFQTNFVASLNPNYVKLWALSTTGTSYKIYTMDGEEAYLHAGNRLYTPENVNYLVLVTGTPGSRVSVTWTVAQQVEVTFYQPNLTVTYNGTDCYEIELSEENGVIGDDKVKLYIDCLREWFTEGSPEIINVNTYGAAYADGGIYPIGEDRYYYYYDMDSSSNYQTENGNFETVTVVSAS